MRLPHGWTLQFDESVSREAVREFIRPALRAVPQTLRRSFTCCHISLVERLADANSASEWTASDELEITIAMGELDPHDAALELLVCLGQALWLNLPDARRSEWLSTLRLEIEHAVRGDIDENAVLKKRRLMATRSAARSRRRLEEYAEAAFAGTVAEYVHALWHDVTIRSGPSHLPVEWLRRRLEVMLCWFPPDRGQCLFADEVKSPHGRV